LKLTAASMFTFLFTAAKTIVKSMFLSIRYMILVSRPADFYSCAAGNLSNVPGCRRWGNLPLAVKKFTRRVKEKSGAGKTHI